jgi:hypothetical protein
MYTHAARLHAHTTKNQMLLPLNAAVAALISLSLLLSLLLLLFAAAITLLLLQLCALLHRSTASLRTGATAARHYCLLHASYEIFVRMFA